jgi:predicted CxxxxCH...CXXCH cytochrome family protein
MHLRTRAAPRSVPATLLLLVVAASCAKARPDVVGTVACVSWQSKIEHLFVDRCGSCHSGPTAAGSYDTSSYLGVLGGGTDAVPDALPGDAMSRLLVVLDPTTADAVHQPVSDLYPKVRNWVVDCQLSYVQSSIHRPGILDPASSDFHGQLIRDEKYAFGLCQQCHGADFSGGSSKVSCLGCHAQGPTGCATCHGAIATSSSHGRHLGGGPLGKSFGCNECHITPKVYTDVGHIFLADGSINTAPAQVTFGATAGLTPDGGVRAGPPSFDHATQTCSNVYCHGAVLGDSAATNTHPVWTSPGTGQADCGACHGLPPNHVNTSACVNCHPSVVDKNQRIIAPDLHIDGKVEFADPATGCTGCHGGPANPAPPPDLAGESSPSAAGVGAHQAHLTAPSHLSGPIACNECHQVPAEVSSAGHFAGHTPGDGPIGMATVFPADPTVGVLAASAGASPRFDPTTVTCAGVYCHGGGTVLAADTTATLARAPVWTATGGLACGVSCHGLPPAFAPHLPTMTRFDCSGCHPRTIDPSGTIIISGPPGAETSAHINGILDVAP